MDDTLKPYANRIARLQDLLRQYEPYLEKWDGIDLNLCERADPEDPYGRIPMVEVSFYKYAVRVGYNKVPFGNKNSTSREFDFTLEEMDKAIDRFRQKVAYEKKKGDPVEGA